MVWRAELLDLEKCKEQMEEIEEIGMKGF